MKTELREIIIVSFCVGIVFLIGKQLLIDENTAVIAAGVAMLVASILEAHIRGYLNWPFLEKLLGINRERTPK